MTPPAKTEVKAKPSRVVRLEVVAVDPALAARRLAEPWQRLLAIVIDLCVIALLSVFTGPVLGIATGVTLAVLGDSRVSDTRTWRVVKWVFRGLGVVVVVLSLASAMGNKLVRTDAFNLGAAERRADLREVYLPPGASLRDYERAVADLEHNQKLLRKENAALRETASGTSIVRWFADFGRTLGLSFGWAGVYFTLLTTWLGGRTPGKWLTRIRIVRLDGKPLHAMDAFIRQGGYAAGLATGTIGFARLLWDANRQTIEDKIAWTVVLRK